MHSIVFESAFNYLYKPICSADKTGYIRQIFPLYLIKLKHIECDWRVLIDESQPIVIHLRIDFNHKDCEIWISTRLNNKVLSVCLSGYDVMWFYRLTPSDVGGGTTCIMRYWENKQWDPSWTSLNMWGEGGVGGQPNRAWPISSKYRDSPCEQNDRQKDLTEDVTFSQLLLAASNENASPQN